MASYGELAFDLTGFIIQTGAVIVRNGLRSPLLKYLHGSFIACIVRVVEARDDPDSPSRNEDGPFSVSALLCSCKFSLLMVSLACTLISINFVQVCATINLLILPLTEGLEPFRQAMSMSFWIFLSNASVAFLLNVAAVFLIGAGSGLILTLAGVFKDILLITGAVVLFGKPVSLIQVAGELSFIVIDVSIAKQNYQQGTALP